MWTTDQRPLLDSILNEIIPPSDDGRILGAGQLGVADFFPVATPYAPDPMGAVTTVLAAVTAKSPRFINADRDAKVTVLRAVEAQAPDAFATLIRLTYMGYYSRPDTRPLFGVGAHPVHPRGYQVPNEAAERLDELTAPVRARGQAFRG